MSAILDAEATTREHREVDEHVRTCADCRQWYERAANVTRLSRLTAAQSVPDLAASIPVERVLPSGRKRHYLRLGLGAVGMLQLVLSGLLSFGGHATSPMHGDGVAGASTLHLAHEAAAWNVALGLAFCWLAFRGRNAAGLLPVLGASVAVLAVLSMADTVLGHVDLTRLASHLPIVLGLLLVLSLARSETPKQGWWSGLGRETSPPTTWPAPTSG